MRRYTIKQHLLIVVLLAAVVAALWMAGILPEAPPLISH
jgi:hypothetical protein